MHLVINTMSAVQGSSVGRVLSRHRTLEAAKRGAKACQPREQGSYLPVIIREGDAAVGAHVSESELSPVETDADGRTW